MHLVTRMIFAAEAKIILFGDFHQLLHHKTKQCRVWVIEWIWLYLLVKLLSSLIVLKDSLIEVFLEHFLVLAMHDDPVLWLSYFLAPYECTATTNTLSKILRISCDNIFWVDHLIRVAGVDWGSQVYICESFIDLLETLFESIYYLAYPPAKSNQIMLMIIESLLV